MSEVSGQQPKPKPPCFYLVPTQASLPLRHSLAEHQKAWVKSIEEAIQVCTCTYMHMTCDMCMHMHMHMHMTCT